MSLSFAKKQTRKKFSIIIQKQVAANQKWLCVGLKCSKKEKMEEKLLPPTFEIDHKHGLQFGGTNDLTNLQALCPDCHRQKSQDEMLKAMDIQREKKTGRSRFFDPSSFSFIKPTPKIKFPIF